MWDGQIEFDCEPVKVEVPSAPGFPRLHLWVHGNFAINYSTAEPDRSVGEFYRYCADWAIEAGHTVDVRYTLQDITGMDKDDGDIVWAAVSTPTKGPLVEALLNGNETAILETIGEDISGDMESLYGRRAVMRWHAAGCP
jgi:hypothetical protein